MSVICRLMSIFCKKRSLTRSFSHLYTYKNTYFSITLNRTSSLFYSCKCQYKNVPLMHIFILSPISPQKVYHQHILLIYVFFRQKPAADISTNSNCVFFVLSSYFVSIFSQLMLIHNNHLFLYRLSYLNPSPYKQAV